MRGVAMCKRGMRLGHLPGFFGRVPYLTPCVELPARGESRAAVSMASPTRFAGLYEARKPMKSRWRVGAWAPHAT